MKNIFKVIGIIVLVAVIGLSFAACGGDDDSGGGDKKPEDKPVAERWGSYNDPASTVTIAYTVASDGVVTANVGGTPAQNWQASISYDYSSNANTRYKYTFEAWTQNGNRSMLIFYHQNHQQNFNLTETITIDSTRKKYTIDGQPLSANGDNYGDYSTPGISRVCFCGGDQLGTFYVRVISIEKVSTSGGGGGGSGGKVTITGLSAYNGKYIYGQGSLAYDDDNIGLLAASTYNISAQTGTGGLISNGSVTLNVWKRDDTGVSLFTGNGYGGFDLYVFNSAAITSSNSYNWEHIGAVALTFSNGGGSGSLYTY